MSLSSRGPELPTASSNGANPASSQPLASNTVPSNSQNQHAHTHHDSSNESQTTTATNDTDRVFTPPGSDSDASSAPAHQAPFSSQGSQLMQLSQLAAAQQKIPEADPNNAQFSRKRMANGTVKHTRDGSSTSPVKFGHSRNTSAVSMASTTGSRIGELAAELKGKLSYAMVKVNHGWQSHTIDEVESLAASQSGSPVSSTSTLHGRHGASASPRPALGGVGISSTATSPAVQHPSHLHPPEPSWRGMGSTRPRSSTSPAFAQGQGLAPPASIQPRQAGPNPRRNSNARYTPAYLSHASPHTPTQVNSLQSTPGQVHTRTPVVDPILFSPHQNMREQEALETLVFMSSPGNSANLKHQLPSSQGSQSRSNGRTALPSSRLAQGDGNATPGRKSLPTAKPQVKRVGFEASPSTIHEMDVDDTHGSPHGRGTPRRRTMNGSISRPPLSVPAGLSGPSRPRPKLRDDDIERMLDRAAAGDDSDSDSEITFTRDRRQKATASIGV